MPLPMLKEGAKGEDVKLLQRLLASQGSFDGAIGGNFGPLTRKAVVYFQMTHLNRQGKPLTVDGEVGPETWWALQNPSGAPQRSGIASEVPSGVRDYRKEILRVAVAEHRDNVKEEPDGSNWGPRVSTYLRACGIGANPWCGAFWSWVVKEATGEFPMGGPQAHVQTAWRRAKRLGLAHEKGNYDAIPGDAFIILYGDGTGHIGCVLAVDRARNPRRFNTIEGNCANRVKCGIRSVSEPKLVGFINLQGDRPEGFGVGLLSADEVAGAGTR